MSIESTHAAVRDWARLAGPRALRFYARARRNRTRILAAAIALGILFMVIHWG